MSPSSNEIKQLIKLGLPLMAAFLSQKGMQVVDTVMMGRISSDALAAGGLGITIFITIFVFCMGSINSVGVLVSHSLGEKNLTKIPACLLNGFCFAIFISLPAMVVLWYGHWFLHLIGESDTIVIFSKELLHAIVWGFPGLMCYLVLREFVSAFSLTHIIMWISALAIPLAFGLNYILIYGKFGLPSFKIAGIGYASAIIQWLMFFSLLVYVKSKPHLNTQLQKIKLQLFAWKTIYKIITIGLPGGMILVLDVTAVLAAGVMMGYFGSAVLAAHQIALQCAGIAFTVPFAFSMATALRVSHSLGEKDLEKTKIIIRQALSIALLIAICFALIFIIFANKISYFYLNPAENNWVVIQSYTFSFLIIVALFQIFDAFQCIVTGALRGLKDTVTPMFLSVICYWILGVGSGYLLAFHTNLGPKGIWYGLAIGFVCTAIILGIRMIVTLKKLGKYYLTQQA